MNAPRLALRPLPGVPFVSVLLAVRNEERHICGALDAVRAQDWPRDRMEILVADGRSTDATRALVERVAARDPRVRLVDNPERFVAQGLNRALAASRGDVIVRVDGHCRIPAGYVRAGVQALRAQALACAGGPVRALGETPIARAIALAMSTPFGVGGATFRFSREECDVDHLPFGVWPREVFERLGGFDEALVRNQDAEFSDRLRRAGGRIRLLPEQVSDYWSRASLGGLWRQYHGYGFWKVRVIRKRGGWPSSPRHLVPAAFVLGVSGGVLAAAVTQAWALAFAVPALYAAFLALATVATWVTRGDGAAALLPLTLPVLHTAYGAGFLRALVIAQPLVSAAPAIAPRELESGRVAA
ncbi:MAG: glycosyltransferase family 2 protein [Candidatus Eisenbacteria bacterium]|uniref:Glycosyltransferase family 2 protein n=1 Tax=Eiseniibacteriota bacterium TaxID=2212470 RepID=A0A933SGM8_UNCEI|nr:glycosyltransferase family 2 protein [Candidatus Eisenbacteria bacterium]